MGRLALALPRCLHEFPGSATEITCSRDLAFTRLKFSPPISNQPNQSSKQGNIQHTPQEKESAPADFVSRPLSRIPSQNLSKCQSINL